MSTKEIKMNQMPSVLILQNYCNFEVYKCNKMLFDNTIRKTKEVIYVNDIVDQQSLFVYINEKFGIGLQNTFAEQLFDNSLFYYSEETDERVHLNDIINKTSFNVDVLNPLRDMCRYFIL